MTSGERLARFGQQPLTIWLSGENNHTIAQEVERHLFDMGHASSILRPSELDIDINVAATILNDAGLICLCCADSDNADDATRFDCTRHSSQQILDTISKLAQLR